MHVSSSILLRVVNSRHDKRKWSVCCYLVRIGTFDYSHPPGCSVLPTHFRLGYGLTLAVSDHHITQLHQVTQWPRFFSAIHSAIGIPIG